MTKLVIEARTPPSRPKRRTPLEPATQPDAVGTVHVLQGARAATRRGDNKSSLGKFDLFRDIPAGARGMAEGRCPSTSTPPGYQCLGPGDKATGK